MHKQPIMSISLPHAVYITTPNPSLYQVATDKFRMKGLSKHCWTALNNHASSFQCRDLGVSTTLSTTDNGTYTIVRDQKLIIDN